MSAHEIALGLQFLYSTLSGDTTLSSDAPGGCYRALAPADTVPIYVIFAYQAGSDVTTMNGVRLMDDLLFQVKAVGPASNTAGLVTAAERIDQLLGGTSAGPVRNLPIVVSSVTIGEVLACWRESPLMVDELVAGEHWTNVGGLYRLQLEQVN